MFACIIVSVMAVLIARQALDKAMVPRNLVIRGMLIVLVCNLAAAGICICQMYRANVTSIERAENGTGTSAQTMIVDIPGKLKKEKITLTVTDQAFTKEEQIKAVRDCKKRLEKAVLGKNKSADRVTENLRFPSGLPGNPTKISWQQDRYDVIDGQGKIDRNALDQDGEEVVLTAHLICGNTEEDVTVPVRLLPRKLGSRQAYLDEIGRLFAKADHRKQTSKEVRLPEEAGGKKIRWRREGSRTEYLVILIGLVTAGGLIASWREKQKKEKHAQQEMLAEDHPKILNLFSMLLRAGLTSGHAWREIVREYEAGKETNGIRPAYEAMSLCVRRIRAGEPGEQVYRDLGLICHDMRYETFGNLIAGNLRRGSSGIADRLAGQARTALEERKAAAVRKGEEAQLKLLGPMMLLLTVVLLSVMVPAFLSMRF